MLFLLPIVFGVMMRIIRLVVNWLFLLVFYFSSPLWILPIFFSYLLSEYFSDDGFRKILHGDCWWNE